MELARDPTLHQGALFVRLRERFTLYPVELGHLESVTINAVATDSSDDDGSAPSYRASARVRFFGSKELLQAAPEPGYRFAFPAQVTKHALLLHANLPDMDARDFAQAAREEVARTKPALAAFRTTVAEYDQRLRERVEAKIRSF